MRTYRFIALWALFSVLILSSQARNPVGVFLSLSSDLFAVPLSEDGLIVKSGGVVAGYAFSPRFHLDFGWEGRMLFEPTQSIYEPKNSLGIGAGYMLWTDKKLSSLELHLQLMKGLESFTNAEDYAAQAGVRWVLSNSFFVGTGVRYDSWNTEKIMINPGPVYNWYWQLGIRMFTGKKK